MAISFIDGAGAPHREGLKGRRFRPMRGNVKKDERISALWRRGEAALTGLLPNAPLAAGATNWRGSLLMLYKAVRR
jgi:hypothetical protein